MNDWEALITCGAIMCVAWVIIQVIRGIVMNDLVDLLKYIFPKLSAGCITALATLIYLILTASFYIFLGVCVYTGIMIAAKFWF